jgi:hypothetical protein
MVGYTLTLAALAERFVPRLTGMFVQGAIPPYEAVRIGCKGESWPLARN